MIEVLFAESESASMKVAKNTMISGKTDDSTSVWLAGKKKSPKKNDIRWIEGTSEEVICLGFMLDVGNIKEDITSQYRKELIYAMYAQEQWEQEFKKDTELRNQVDVYVRELQCLKEYLEQGETIRIWYSDAPYSACGFYQICSILSEYENQVRIVKMPEHIVRGNMIISFRNWGEVEAEEFACFLQYEKELSREEIRRYRSLWYELQEDNSPLRAVINGQIVGVTEEFYDFLIWKRLRKESIKEARLIGDILGIYPVNIGDWWYAGRINYFIEKGKIKVVKDSENKYARWISLV